MAALAACDAPSGAFGPRNLRAPHGLRDVVDSTVVVDSTATADSTVIVPLPDSTATTTSDETCRSGYHIAYRDDGTWSCDPDVIDQPTQIYF